MTHQIIYKGIRDTNTFCKNCLKPRMFTKRNTICECGARACLVNLPLKTNLKYPSYKLGVELEGTWFDEPLDANLDGIQGNMYLPIQCIYYHLKIGNQ